MTVHLAPNDLPALGDPGLDVPVPADSAIGGRSGRAVDAVRSLAGLAVLLGLWLVLFRSDLAGETAGALLIGLGAGLAVVAELLRAARRRAASGRPAA